MTLPTTATGSVRTLHVAVYRTDMERLHTLLQRAVAAEPTPGPAAEAYAHLATMEQFGMVPAINREIDYGSVRLILEAVRP